MRGTEIRERMRANEEEEVRAIHKAENLLKRQEDSKPGRGEEREGKGEREASIGGTEIKERARANEEEEVRAIHKVENLLKNQEDSKTRTGEGREGEGGREASIEGGN